MVHFISLYTLQKSVDDDQIDEMIRTSRSQLFRVHEVHNVRSGRKIDARMEYPFFICMDFESMDKLNMFREDPVWVKFQKDVLASKTASCTEMIYETEPGKNVKYS